MEGETKHTPYERQNTAEGKEITEAITEAIMEEMIDELTDAFEPPPAVSLPEHVLWAR